MLMTPEITDTPAIALRNPANPVRKSTGRPAGAWTGLSDNSSPLENCPGGGVIAPPGRRLRESNEVDVGRRAILQGRARRVVQGDRVGRIHGDHDTAARLR